MRSLVSVGSSMRIDVSPPLPNRKAIPPIIATATQRYFRSIQNVSEQVQDFKPVIWVSSVCRMQTSRDKSEDWDDGRFCVWAVGQKERAIGNRSRRRDRRRFGPNPSLHPVRIARSPHHRRRPIGAGGSPRRRRNLCSWGCAALLYRLLGGGYLLPGKPQVAFPDGASTHMRFVLWRRGRKSHDPCRLAALRSSRPGPYELHDLLLGLLVHMVVVGLPISFSVRRFAK